MAVKGTGDNAIDPIEWDIFLKDNEAKKDKITISLGPGECLFIVGANGSGKSALIQQCFAELHRKGMHLERYAAHRQLWFERDFGPSGKQEEEIQNQRRSTVGNESLYASRTNNPSYDNFKHEYTFHNLVQQCMNFSNRMKHLNASSNQIIDIVREREKLETENPFKRFNNLLKYGKIPIKLESNSSGGNPNVRHNDNDLNISIRELSDGERFTFLLAATVMTLPPGGVLLVDEPDLHLHQSIINPFFSALIASRKDCFFYLFNSQSFFTLCST